MVVGLVEGKQSQLVTLVKFFSGLVVTDKELSIVVYVVIKRSNVCFSVLLKVEDESGWCISMKQSPEVETNATFTSKISV